MKSTITFFIGLFSGAVITAIYYNKKDIMQVKNLKTIVGDQTITKSVVENKEDLKQKADLIKKIMTRFGDPSSPYFNQEFKDKMTVDILAQYDNDSLKKLLTYNPANG